MTLSLIVAVADDRAIGQDNSLPWHLPADLKRFRETTTGHTVLMGRNAYLSLPKGALPNRRNVIVSATLKEAVGAEVYPSIEVALEAVKNDGEVFLIGGAQLYEAILPFCDKLYLTTVKGSFPDADTFFPELDLAEWNLVEESSFPSDEKNAYETVLTVYDRINSPQRRNL